MTGKERQQRYIDRLIGAAAKPAQPDERDREIAALKARIAELKAELARERAKKRRAAAAPSTEK
jgi:hypothetical protein